MKVTEETIWTTDDGRQLLRAPKNADPERAFVVVPSQVSHLELRELALAIGDALNSPLKDS